MTGRTRTAIVTCITLAASIVCLAGCSADTGLRHQDRVMLSPVSDAPHISTERPFLLGAGDGIGNDIFRVYSREVLAAGVKP